jgi:hypothetical protein
VAAVVLACLSWDLQVHVGITHFPVNPIPAAPES